MPKRKMIAASILSADFTRLEEEIRQAQEAGVDWLHLDVMDGCFVPNISFGLPVVESVKKISKAPLDVHLMILDPQRYVQSFRKAGADIITVHLEACIELADCTRKIRDCGAKAGVSINPDTPINSVCEILSQIDLLLIMGVEPGFGGQKLKMEALRKIRVARKLIDEGGHKVILEVDGGINGTTAQEVAEAGADVLVAGSFIFKNPLGVVDAVSKLREHI